MIPSSDRELCAQGEWRPGRLWSLWEIMRPFHAAGLISLARVMGVWLTPSSEPDEILPETRTARVRELNDYRQVLSELSLPASKASLGRVIDTIGDSASTWTSLEDVAEELAGRLIDETNDKVFFSLTLPV
jgi:hypothetical protein